jgi:hypothetical protein
VGWAEKQITPPLERPISGGWRYGPRASRSWRSAKDNDARANL